MSDDPGDFRHLLNTLSVSLQNDNNDAGRRHSRTSISLGDPQGHGTPINLNLFFLSSPTPDIRNVVQDVVGVFGSTTDTSGPVPVAASGSNACISAPTPAPTPVPVLSDNVLRSSKRLPKSYEVPHPPPDREDSPGPQPYIPKERKWAAYEPVPAEWLLSDSDPDSDSDESEGRFERDLCRNSSSEGSESDEYFDLQEPPVELSHTSASASTDPTYSDLVTSYSSTAVTVYPSAPVAEESNASQPSSSRSKGKGRDVTRALPQPPVATTVKPALGPSDSRKASSSSGASSSRTFGPGSILPPRAKTSKQKPETSGLQLAAPLSSQEVRTNEEAIKDQQQESFRGSHVQYGVNSKGSTHIVNGWHRAGSMTQGVPNTQVRRLTPRPPNNYGTHKWFVVTRGRKVGVFHGWQATRLLVDGFSGAVFKGYTTREEAQLRFRASLERRAVSQGVPGPSTHVRFASQPVGFSDIERYTNRDRHPTPENAHAVVVFRGLQVGIFQDWLDCADYVVGVHGAIYNTYDTMEDAIATYEAARAEGFLRIIPS